MVAWPLDVQCQASISKAGSFSPMEIINLRKKTWFVSKPQRSTLLIFYQICKILQTAWPSACNTLGTIAFAKSWQWPSGWKNSLYHNLDKLESLLLLWNKLKTHSCSKYLVKVLKQHSPEQCMLLSNIQEAHKELGLFLWKGYAPPNSSKFEKDEFSWRIFSYLPLCELWSCLVYPLLQSLDVIK